MASSAAEVCREAGERAAPRRSGNEAAAAKQLHKRHTAQNSDQVANSHIQRQGAGLYLQRERCAT